MPTVEHVPKLFRPIFAYMSAPNLLTVSTVCARVESDGGCMKMRNGLGERVARLQVGRRTHKEEMGMDDDDFERPEGRIARGERWTVVRRTPD